MCNFLSLYCNSHDIKASHTVISLNLNIHNEKSHTLFPEGGVAPMTDPVWVKGVQMYTQNLLHKIPIYTDIWQKRLRVAYFDRLHSSSHVENSETDQY